MRLAVVVQRYGAELKGGAELHARYLAEHLAHHADVEVLTTCARDYITWRNEFPAGLDTVNGLPVRRFPVRRERRPDDFGRRSTRVFTTTHSLSDELAWLSSEGPHSPGLLRYIRRQATRYDYFIFFSYRYYHAYHGIRSVGPRALLVPTAERDPAIALNIFGPAFRGVRAIMYNSFEEQALIRHVSDNADVPGVVVGVGSRIPSSARPERFRQRTGLTDRFMLYVGRIDENKGCGELFEYFRRYATAGRSRLRLVLIGDPVMPVPSHPLITHLGSVTDQEKYDALAAADLLVMPSYFESLSMVTLEAWALALPVLVNGRCDVLRGQAVRSRAGLYYTSYDEFAEALAVLERDPDLRAVLGTNGRSYFLQHYDWRVIEGKYLTMLDQLQREDRDGGQRAIEPLPGWRTRRRRVVPAAQAILNQIPTGPVLPGSEAGA